MFRKFCYPPEKSDNSITSEFSSSQESTHKPLINSFTEFSWGTSKDEVFQSVTKDISEYAYSLEKQDRGIESLNVIEGNVGGYDARVSYLFSDDSLIAGGYSINDTLDESGYEDLVEKFTSKYGKPSVSKESTGWGPLLIWIDQDKNFIYFEDSGDIGYVKNDSPIIPQVADQLKKYHEIDLQSELNKVGNTNGI